MKGVFGVLLSLTLPAIAGCGGPTPARNELPPAQPALRASPSAVVDAGGPHTAEVDARAAITGVIVVDAPARVTIDGRLAEWAPPTPGQPLETTTRVAIAFTNEAVWVAAALPPQEQLWLGMGAEPSPVPRIGEPASGDQLSFLPEYPEECDHQPPGSFGGREKLRSWIDECHRLAEQRQKLVTSREPGFTKRFRIDRHGVAQVGEDHALVPVPDAKSAWTTDPAGVIVEASLPVRALPRLSAAPLESVLVWVTDKPETGDPEEWVSVALPHPVSFEPFGDVRRRAFEAQKQRWDGSGSFYAEQSPGLSYQPGDWLHFERLVYETFTTIAPRVETLYDKKGTVGDVEVGVNLPQPEWPPTDTNVRTGTQWLTILDKGKPAGVLELPGAFRAAVLREGAIHVLSFRSYKHVMATGRDDPKWSVIAVASDGSHRELLPEPCVTIDDNGRICGGNPIEVANPDWTRFGWRMTCGKRVALTWTWDATNRSYSCALTPGATK